MKGLTLIEATHAGEDFVDKATGQAWDVMGGKNAMREGMGSFLSSILKHTWKRGNNTFLDLSALSREQRQQVVDYISTFSEAAQGRLFYN